MRLNPASFRKNLLAGLAAAVLTTSVTVSASTVAHYRFEDGSAGGTAAQAVDSSPNAFHLDAIGEPVYGSDVPVSSVPRTGDDNTLAIDLNVENPGGNTQNAFEGVADEGLSALIFDDFTIEAWVRYDNPANPQTIVGRDDSAPGFTGSNHGLVYFQSNNSGFRIEVFTSDNELISANSSVVPQAGVWYHVAAVGDTQAGENGVLSLYVDGDLVAEVDGFPGLADSPDRGPWTIGRGIWENNQTDWINGQIDEVRISDAALAPTQFLNYDPDAFLFTAQPQDVTAWAGTDVTFEAAVEFGENPDPVYQWEESADDGATWDDVPGAESASLTLSSVGVERDRARFRVAVTSGERTITSDEAVLRVGDGEPVQPEGVVAHYRFEDGSDGAAAGAAVDSSGNGHDLGVFQADGVTVEPFYTAANVPVSLLPATGEANELAMDFEDEDTGIAFESGEGDALNDIVFDDFTFEAWVRQESVGAPHTFIGRDDSGAPGDGAQFDGGQSLVYFQSGWDGNFRVEVVTRDNSLLAMHTAYVPQPDDWHHVAAVGDSEAGTMSFYVDGELQGSVDGFDGLWIPEPATPWTVGRGQWEGNPTDYMDGQIDEVRISNSALTPVEFLNFNAAVLTFVTHPQDVTAAAQDEVVFTSLAGGGSGELAYQWQVSEDAGETWQDIDGATGASYTIESASIEQDGNQYRVVATRGDATEISDVATLEVPDFPDPVITQDLEPGLLIFEGETFSYAVEATGLGNISYQWRIDGSDLEGETGNTLTFDPATTDLDESVLSVVVTDDAAEDEGLDPTSVTLSTILSVAPRLKQAISLNFVGTGSGEFGSTNELGIIQPQEVAGAVPVANWNNSAEVDNVANQETPLELVDDTGASTTASATWSSANTWSARAVAGPAAQKDPDERLFHGYIEARAGSGEVDAAATVTIDGIPFDTYDVYVYPMGVEGAAGTFGRSVTMEDESGVRQLFMRNFMGDPTPTEIPFILSHATDVDEAMDGHMATYFRFAGASGSTVTLQHFDEVDWNSGGFAAVSIVDTSEDTPARPVFVERPADQFLPGGADAVFGVSAESYNDGGSLSYQWRKDGEDLAGETGASLTVSNVTSADTGEYSVVVTDDSNLGTSINTATATLVVVDEARPALLSVDMNIGGHESMSGHGMLRTDGVVEFVYPPNTADNPMNIGEGDTVWNALLGSAGTATFDGLVDSEGLGLPGVTFTVTDAAAAEDVPGGGGLEAVDVPEGDPTYSAPLFRDYVYTEGDDEMTLTVGGLHAFAGLEVTLVVYAVGKDSANWADIEGDNVDQNDVATVTLAEANNEFDEAPVATEQEEGREMRWNDRSFAAFEARVAANGTVSWTIGPVAGEPGLNAFNGFQLLVTAEGEAIEPEGIADWRQDFFGTSANEGDAANGADPDGDGFVNLMEYALGTDPTVAGEAHSAVVRGREGDFLTLSFNHIADPDLTYAVEATDDLAGEWVEVANFGSFAGEGTQTYTDDQAVGDNPSRFLRLKVTIAE